MKILILLFSLFITMLLLPVSVLGDVQVYGVARISIDVIDDSEQRNTGVSSNLSYVGVKGGHKINDALQGEYKVEMGFDATGETGDLSARWRYIGLTGKWGRMRVGNLATPFRVLGKFIDEFSETVGEYRGVLGLNASGAPKYDRWSANTITYTTPKKNGLSADLTYSSAYKGASTASGMDDNDETMSGLSINYMLKQLQFRMAYETHEDDQSNGIRVVARYSFDNTRLGFVYESIDAGVGNGLTRDAYGVNLAHTVNDLTYKTQIWIADDYDGRSNSGAVNTNLGVFKKLDKQVSLYVIYAATNNDQYAKYTIASIGHNGDIIKPISAGDDIKAFSIGGAYSF